VKCGETWPLLFATTCCIANSLAGCPAAMITDAQWHRGDRIVKSGSDNSGITFVRILNIKNSGQVRLLFIDGLIQI
jgi:hypothetical protein